MGHKKILAAVLLFVAANSFPQTNISPGEVYGSWGASGSPYLIQGDITIPNDSTLTIELAVGNASQNITFTINDTSGFYNPEITQGGWNGIQFKDTPPENDTSKIKG